MQRLRESLTFRADRGIPAGADTMVERIAAELRGQEALRVVAFTDGKDEMTTQTGRRRKAMRPTPPRRPLRRAGLAFGAALILMLAAVGAVVPLLDRSGETADTSTATVTTARSTTDVTTTTAEPTTTSTSSTPTSTSIPLLVIPTLGEGWELVLSSRPGDAPSLDPTVVISTGMGYYVAFWEDDWYLMTFNGDEPALVDVDISADGFVTGGPGVVAWANVGPEANTGAQLWASSNGIDFERVAPDLLAGCSGISGCRGSEIYAAATSPAGRVVALAYDPLVRSTDCDGCFDLNPVVLVSNDGYEWTRHALDLLTVLPAEWQGAADIRSPLVYVAGRWLTYATHYSNNGTTTDTAFFASADGIDWQAVGTGALFDETYLLGMVANDRGVVAITREDVYWSGDGNEWTRSTLTSRDDALKVVAYENGYVAVSTPRVPEDASATVDTIWYSTDGSRWSRMALQLEEAVIWNAIASDGPNLMAIGVTLSNLRGIWRWSG